MIYYDPYNNDLLWVLGFIGIPSVIMFLVGLGVGWYIWGA